MNIFVQILITSLVCIANICCECGMCQSSNYVACHEENVYSLCVNGSATTDYITCPEKTVCTTGAYVCYPSSAAKPSCEHRKNVCGVCSKNKVYACTNETTIAFCYGEDKPVEGAEVSYCLEDTVCDIYSEKGFCTERFLAKPSCVTSGDEGVITTTKMSAATTESAILDTTTTPRLTTIATSIEPAPTTLTVQPITTTATTTAIKPTTTTTELSTASKTTDMTRLTTTATAASTVATKPPTSTASTPTDPTEICKLHAKSGSIAAEDPTCTTMPHIFQIE